MNASVPNCFCACVKYTQIMLCHYPDLRNGYMYVAFTWELLAEFVLPWLTNQAVRGVTKKLSCSLKSGGRQHSSNVKMGALRMETQGLYFHWNLGTPV